ncbi:MAG: SGNH/GDSL hydrolase family protein [Candidatus Hinthialibacter antarcticus]|nr:SGNH/GDSL hydrolase family protein [Candidatus Hinthialibacter antarcticus]
MKQVQYIVFFCLLIFMVVTSVVGTATVGFAFLEWRATPIEKEVKLDASKVDLAPELVPYVMFGSPKNTTWHEVFMPAYEGDENPPTIALNEHRFRYGALDLAKPDDERRIFMLGGSVVFYGHTNETTIAGYLEEKLNSQNNQATHVVNAGVTGYISEQELVLLTTKILDFSPDAVIVFDGFNDFLMPTSYGLELGQPFKFDTLELAWYESKDMLRRLAAQPFHRHMLAGSHFMRRFSPHWSYVRFLRDDEIDKEKNMQPPQPLAMAEHLMNNWRKMAKQLEAYRIGGLFILQPFSMSDSGDYDVQYGAVEAALPQLNADFAHCQPAIQFKSYRNVMAEKKALFYDVVHTYDEGNRYYAELMARDLRLQ